MPFNVRSIATGIAVICFFSLSFIGWISGLSPFICCKRALAGTVLAYIAGSWALKAINAILMNAMITNHISKQKGQGFGGKD
jgi:hypothetical protein